MDFGLDFYLVIAYLIPGLIGLKAVSLYNRDLDGVLQNFHTNEKHAGAVTIVLVGAIVIGMAISVGRATTIDLSFALDMSRLSDKEQFAAVDRCDPNYKNLGESTSKQQALELLVKTEKRPYQFYGNVMIAMLLFAFAYMNKKWREESRMSLNQLLLSSTVLVVVVLVLYLGARSSHYRYMASLSDLTGCLGGA